MLKRFFCNTNVLLVLSCLVLSASNFYFKCMRARVSDTEKISESASGSNKFCELFIH